MSWFLPLAIIGAIVEAQVAGRPRCQVRLLVSPLVAKIRTGGGVDVIAGSGVRLKAGVCVKPVLHTWEAPLGLG